MALEFAPLCGGSALHSGPLFRYPILFDPPAPRAVQATKDGGQQAQHEDEHAEAASPQQPLPPEQQQQQRQEEPAQEAGAKGASKDAPAPME